MSKYVGKSMSTHEIIDVMKEMNDTGDLPELGTMCINLLARILYASGDINAAEEGIRCIGEDLKEGVRGLFNGDYLKKKHLELN
jgi:hypothetical protein